MMKCFSETCGAFHGFSVPVREPGILSCYACLNVSLFNWAVFYVLLDAMDFTAAGQPERPTDRQHPDVRRRVRGLNTTDPVSAKSTDDVLRRL